MNRVLEPQIPVAYPHAPAPRRIVRRLLLHCALLVLAAVAFVAHEHFRLAGQSTASLVTLIVAGLLALAPVRAIVGEVFSISGHALHALHGLGALAFVGLAASGVFSGAPLLQHTAMAPFAIMGAAQAMMHQNHPRNAKQAEALRRFASSLPEVAQFTQSRDLTSPENIARAVRVLNDLITKAEALGETELEADPNFQSAWAQATTRTGLTLGLDVADQAINRLAENPAAAAAVPGLRARLAQARSLARAGSPHSVGPGR